MQAWLEEGSHTPASAVMNHPRQDAMADTILNAICGDPESLHNPLGIICQHRHLYTLANELAGEIQGMKAAVDDNGDLKRWHELREGKVKRPGTEGSFVRRSA